MSGGPLAIRPFSRPLPFRLRRAVLISGHGFQLTGGSMTTFDNPEKAFEDKLASDSANAFRIAARRTRLLGTCAAQHEWPHPHETHTSSQQTAPPRVGTELVIKY